MRHRDPGPWVTGVCCVLPWRSAVPDRDPRDPDLHMKGESLELDERTNRYTLHELAARGTRR